MEFNITKRDGTVLTVLVSEADADLSKLRWHMAGGKGGGGRYAALRDVDGRTVYLHSVVAQRMGIEVEQAAAGGAWRLSIDHINGDKLDNRRENLRLRTRSQQMLNPNDRPCRRNTSGYRGVSFDRKAGKWTAYARKDYRSMCLGLFATKEEAIARRQQWDRVPWVSPRREPAPCGTPAGYHAHWRRQEAACDACKAAINAYINERRLRVRSRQET